MPIQRKRHGLEAFLRRLHFKLRCSPRRIESQLRLLMGPKRYKRYLAITDGVHAGRLPIRATYESVETLEEANVERQHQSRWRALRRSPELTRLRLSELTHR